MFFQFRARKYVPGIYWLTVVLISIVGTLITDNLTDNLGVALATTTVVFGVVLVATFAVWYASEKTLSIHTIYTTRREGFYWAAILFTFALGTAAGDLVSEKLNLGYWVAALIFGALIALVAISHLGFKVSAVLAFWIAYILTRPFGASIGTPGRDHTPNPHAARRPFAVTAVGRPRIRKRRWGPVHCGGAVRRRSRRPCACW
jgi:uncharacterized membrane-anchored protein